MSEVDLDKVLKDLEKTQQCVEEILGELKLIRKEGVDRWCTAPVWAFPYQGRKELLRNEVLFPITKEMTVIKDMILECDKRKARTRRSVSDMPDVIVCQSSSVSGAIRDISEVVVNCVGIFCWFFLVVFFFNSVFWYPNKIK